MRKADHAVVEVRICGGRTGRVGVGVGVTLGWGWGLPWGWGLALERESGDTERERDGFAWAVLLPSGGRANV